MLIISGIAVLNGTNSLDKIKLKGFYSELEIIQEKVDDISETNETYTDNESKQTINLKTESGSVITAEQSSFLRTVSENIVPENFRYFTIEDLQKYMDLYNMNYNVFIDFTNKIVIVENGVKIGQKTYYMLENKRIYIEQNVGKNTGNISITCQIETYTTDKYKITVTPTNTIGDITENSGTIKYKKASSNYWEKTNDLYFIIEELTKYNVVYTDINGNTAEKVFIAYKNEDSEPRVGEGIVVFTINTTGEEAIIKINDIETNSISVEEGSVVNYVITYGCNETVTGTKVVGEDTSIDIALQSSIEHTYADWITEKAATCLECGTKYRICNKCGAKETGTIAITEHTYGDWIIEKEATCLESGTRSKVCSGCGKTETETIAATGHTYGDWITEKAATCSEDGTKYKICSGCGEKETETIAATGHTYGDWIIEKEATCLESGTKYKVCSGCGGTETETIAALGHSHEITSTVESSYSGRGYNVFTCSRCGDSYTQNITTLYIINRLSWNKSNWTAIFDDTTKSGIWDTSMGGALSTKEIGIAVSYNGNYGVAYTGPINLTDAKRIELQYRVWDNYYEAFYDYGKITTYIGLADSGDLGNNTEFVSGKYTSYTMKRTSTSDTPVLKSYTIDVSDLTGSYYFKVYTKHTISTLGGAYTAYTSFPYVRIIYND